MSRPSIALVAVAAVTVLSAGPAAQTPAAPTVDQILDKHVAAIGGRAALEKLTTMSGHGTIEIPDASITGSIELYAKAPNKSLTIVTLEGIGQQFQGFDGTTAWSEDPQMGYRTLAGAELAEARRNSIFARELQMKTLFPTMTVKGQEKVGTRAAWVVEGVPTDGTAVRMYFDAENGLLVRQVGTRVSPQGPIEVDLRFDDYRDVGGVKHAFTIRQLTSMFTAVIRLAEIAHNTEIDDATFRKR